MTAQFIKTDGEGELVVLTRRDYDALLARAGVDEAEEVMTTRLVREARATREAGGDQAMPEWLSRAILDGENPLRAARKHMGMTQASLAERAHVTQGHLSDLESGKKRLGGGALGQLAGVLAVHPDWIAD